MQIPRFGRYLVWICVGCCEAVDVREGDVSGDLEVLPEEQLDAGLENVAAEFRLLLHLEGFSVVFSQNCTNSY